MINFNTSIKHIFSIFLLFLSCSIYGQEAYQPGKFIPPSPTAASLGVYGNFPVSYYSGMPSITIPVYNIKTSNHNLNIQLDYNASGVKPAQEASWVGLGWSLSSGGVITRTARGKNDFASDGLGYYSSPALPPSADDNSYQPTSNLEDDKSFFNGVQNNFRDGDPDLFNYNFAGYTGRFVQGKSVDGSPVFMDHKNNLKVVFTNGQWVVTDAKGYKYYFGTQEISEDWYAPGTSVEFGNPVGLNGLAIDNSSFRSATAWYLDSLVAPTTEKIQFEYSKAESLSLLNKSEQQYVLVNLVGGNCAGTPNLPGTFRSYNASRQVISDVNLKRISFALGSIEFGATTREDIEYKDASKIPVKLSTIAIKDLNGQLLKQYNLSYTYFLDQDGTKRLKLDSIEETGADGLNKKPYSFSYFGGNDSFLPPKYTKSIDHWGFYNGIGNTSLLPQEIDPSGLSQMLFPGGNREPDISHDYIKTGVLSSIRYPTGGHTDFDYELHDYSNLRGDEALSPVPQFVSVSNSDPNNPHKAVDFDIIKEQPVTIAYVYDEFNCAPCNPNGTSQIFASLTKDGQPVAGLYVANPDGTLINVNVVTLKLPAGHYSLAAQGLLGYTTSVTASYNTFVPILQKAGGGIRIKSITSFDNQGSSTIKKYDYTNNGKSSGRLLAKPLYDSFAIANELTQVGCSYTASYVIRMSSSVNQPGLSSTGSIIGYDKVTELIGANGEGGKTEFYFFNNEEITDTYPNIPDIGDARSGNLIESIAYNSNGKPVKKTDYEYTLEEVNSIKGVKVFGLPFIQEPGYPNYVVRFYDNLSSWYVKSSEKTVLYNGTDSISTATFTNYGNEIHKLPTSAVTINSTGDSLKHIYHYPLDMVNNGNDPTGIYSLMSNNHIYDPVIEDLTLKNNTFLEKTKTNYSNAWVNQIIKPLSVESQVLTFPSEPRLSYFGYDNIGNVLSISKASGPATTYLWSYNKQYPIAEISNATYAEIVGILGSTAIENFSRLLSPGKTDIDAYLAPLRADLPSALITSYSYLPMAGMATVTDPKGVTTSYDYDSLQRLKNVKDKDGNIIQNNSYHYKN